jgi:hypothetical protein
MTSLQRFAFVISYARMSEFCIPYRLARFDGGPWPQARYEDSKTRHLKAMFFQPQDLRDVIPRSVQDPKTRTSQHFLSGD